MKRRKSKKRAARLVEYESHCHECGDCDAFAERWMAERWFDDHASCEDVSLYAYRLLIIKRRGSA